MRLLPATLCLTIGVLASPTLQAVKLYKLTHADGSVSYHTDLPRRAADARMEIKDVDPDVNVVPIEQFPLDGNYHHRSASPWSARPDPPSKWRLPPPWLDDADATAGPREPDFGGPGSASGTPDVGTPTPAPHAHSGP